MENFFRRIGYLSGYESLVYTFNRFPLGNCFKIILNMGEDNMQAFVYNIQNSHSNCKCLYNS